MWESKGSATTYEYLHPAQGQRNVCNGYVYTHHRITAVKLLNIMIKPETVTSGKMLNTAVEERSIDVRKTYR